MSPSSLSVALDAIVDTPDDEFQRHPKKVRDAFLRLQSLLRSQDSISHHQSDPSEPKDGSQARPDKQDPPNSATFNPPQPNAAQNSWRQDHSNVLALLEPQHHDPHLQQVRIGLPPHAALVDRLQEKYQAIEDFLRSQASKSIAKEPKSREEDPRVLDIMSCERHTVTMEQQILRALGQRSLAKDFDQWARQTYGRSRIDELVETLDAPENASGHISEFVRKLSTVHDEPVAARGIAHGIRLLVIEQLAGFCGTSALLSFSFRDLRYLKYAHFPDLVLLLRGTKLHDLSEEFSSLFAVWQDIYDEKCKYEKDHRKRRRLDYEEKEELANRVAEWSTRITTTSNIVSETRLLRRKTPKNLTATQSRFLDSEIECTSKKRRKSQQSTFMSACSKQRFQESCDALPNRRNEVISTAYVGDGEANQEQGNTTVSYINPTHIRALPCMSSIEQHQFETQFEPGQSGLDALVQAANFEFRNSDVQLPDPHMSATLPGPNASDLEATTHSRDVTGGFDPHQKETPSLPTPHSREHGVLQRGPDWPQLNHTYEGRSESTKYPAHILIVANSVDTHNSQLSSEPPTVQLEERPCGVQGSNTHASNNTESAFSMLQNGNTTSDNHQDANFVDWFVSGVAEVLFEDVM